MSPGLTAPAYKPRGRHSSCLWKGTRGTSVVGIKTQDGTAKQYDPGTSGFSVYGASGRYSQLICCHGQMILDGSTLAVPLRTCPPLVVLFFLRHSHLLFIFLCWVSNGCFMCWGRGLKEVFFSGDTALVSFSSPFLFHVLEDINYNANQKGHSSPIRSLREVVCCWSSCIGCIEMIHFDILDMKCYDFLMKNMGLDVLCTPPAPRMSVRWIF